MFTKKQKIILLLFVIGLLLPAATQARGDFKWAPITAADWSVAEDTAKDIRGAVMLFEKVIANDRLWVYNECYLSFYRRIKVFNAAGRNWGDVSAPYLDKAQKIEEIRGRTVLPDGRIFSLQKKDAFEKEIYITKKGKVKQKSFSLPGIVDGCIVEYYIKYRLPRPHFTWSIQKEIRLLRGECEWLFYRGGGLNPSIYGYIAGDFTPNHVWINTTQGKAEQRFASPPFKKPEAWVFRIEEVPAFADEPYSPPEIALKTRLYHYYGQAASADEIWKETANNMATKLSPTWQTRRFRDLVAPFAGLENNEKKIAAAYQWLQTHLKNLSYIENAAAFKKNETLDDALERGYGTQSEINLIFYYVLRALQIDAKLAYVVDRDDNWFTPEAKYWQFDRTLVAVPNHEGYHFYSPGDLHVQIGQVPWFNESSSALLIGDKNRLFIDVPHSSAEINKMERRLVLQLTDELKLAGVMLEQSRGHRARAIRLLRVESEANTFRENLHKQMQEILPTAEIDSLAVKDEADSAQSVALHGKVNFPGIKKPLGNRLLLSPLTFFSEAANPFHAEFRRHPIVFDYAYDLLETLSIEMPGKWRIEALPRDTTFANVAGSCEVRFKAAGKALSVQRRFILNRPLWQNADYAFVRRLFQTRQAFNTLTAVLKQ